MAIKKKPPPKKRAATKKAAKRRPSASSPDELLREELTFARQELKRVATAENVVKRELEAALSNERNANDRLRAELDAVRLDLKTALADLEIARREMHRETARALALGREMAAAQEAQRLAEHAATSTREQLYELRREAERLRAELKRPA
jgi:chromosome segregation ATPase